ncbi:MAG: hypothetical protein ACOX69_08470 [Coriobacteriales bacterium]|jgi:hypothetical protein
MSDYKSVYSEASQYYVEKEVPSSGTTQAQYDRSKAREAEYNENWKKRPVNLNEICDKFAPGDDGYKDGVKWKFNGERYQVVADMASGYLCIYDKETKTWCKLDGTPGNGDETHFKILRREEM